MCVRLNNFILHIITHRDEQIQVNIDQSTQLKSIKLQGGREVTVHQDNTHLSLNISLHCTAQHAVQCKMVGWQQCAR
jgi:hypothetical protein